MHTKRVFQQILQKTHMPFYNDGTLVFCTNSKLTRRHFGRKYGLSSPSDYRPWSLAYADWHQKQVRPIRVDLPEDSVLCNPTFYRENGNIIFSFVAGVPNEEKLDYHLYRMTGPSWDDLGEAVQAVPEYSRTGFVSPRHCCIGGESYLVLYDKEKNEWQKLITSLDRIARAVYDPDRPSQILITGLNGLGIFCTLAFDVDTHETRELQGPDSVYKCCLVGNRLVYSYRESPDLEDYQLHVGTANFVDTGEAVELTLR